MEFNVQTEDKELKSQMDTLLRTRAGSVPADRDFGIDWSCLDHPPEVAENLFYQEVLAKAERYIPEVKISRVDMDSDVEGGMSVRIGCERRGDYE
ncbi:MAG: hypothetical protein ACLUKK_01920 [Lacrimispora saccharolytica]